MTVNFKLFMHSLRYTDMQVLYVIYGTVLCILIEIVTDEVLWFHVSNIQSAL